MNDAYLDRNRAVGGWRAVALACNFDGIKEKNPVQTYDKFTKITLTFANITKEYPKTIYLVSLGVVIFSIIGTTQLVVESSVINYFKENRNLPRYEKNR